MEAETVVDIWLPDFSLLFLLYREYRNGLSVELFENCFGLINKVDEPVSRFTCSYRLLKCGKRSRNF